VVAEVNVPDVGEVTALEVGDVAASEVAAAAGTDVAVTTTGGAVVVGADATGGVGDRLNAPCVASTATSTGTSPSTGTSHHERQRVADGPRIDRTT
jgi:hypothetical protein